ncbi:MAG: helix-turn-helix domain-containing protein [Lentisphaeria bacterium]|nr:helix-turn-helix domain-containing protein [Lentisphaeria bacterium]
MAPTHWQLENFIEKNRLPLYFVHVRPGTHPPEQYHDHNSSEIVIILQGNAEHIVKTGKKISSAPISPGDLLVIHPGVAHAYKNTSTLELINLVYDFRQLVMPQLDAVTLPLFREFFPDTPPPFPTRATPAAHLSPAELVQLRPLIFDYAQTLNDFGAGSLFQAMALFMQLTVTIAKMRPEEKISKNPVPDNISKVLHRIAGEYASVLTLDTLARTASMSRRNFTRRFREITGLSCSRYIMLFRLQQAAEMMKNPGNDLGQIALSCGFCDSNYLCKKFRQIYGESPGAFRKRFAAKLKI